MKSWPRAPTLHSWAIVIEFCTLTLVGETFLCSWSSNFLSLHSVDLTVGPRIGNTDRKKILESADRYIEAFGVEERPAVSTSFLDRMGFMKNRPLSIEEGGEGAALGNEAERYELVDGTFPTINTRITRQKTAGAALDDEDQELLDQDLDDPTNLKPLSRKKRQEEFEARVGLPETEYIQINESEWEDFIDFKPGMPKIIEKLHSPQRMGHFGNRPSKKTVKIYSDNDGW